MLVGLNFRCLCVMKFGFVEKMVQVLKRLGARLQQIVLAAMKSIVTVVAVEEQVHHLRHHHMYRRISIVPLHQTPDYEGWWGFVVRHLQGLVRDLPQVHLSSQESSSVKMWCHR